MKEKFSLKDHLFNVNKIEVMANAIHAVYSPFDTVGFIEETVYRFSELELKQRISWIAEMLKVHLPDNFQEACLVLLHSLPAPCDPTLSDDDFGDFIYAPYSDFVAKNGCNSVDLAGSLETLKAITTRFSAEDAIRYFINAFPSETMSTLNTWSKDSHYHVRRLASEGARPKLPWSQKINLRPEEALPILDHLFSDKTRFVTRSVANHLNDISKLNPDLVLDTLEKWRGLGLQNEKEMAFIVKHSLRTLIKLGHKRAIQFLDVSVEPAITVTGFEIKTPNVILGDSVVFECEISAQKEEKLIIDYCLFFQSKLGNVSNKKMYKLKQVTLEAGESLKIVKRHPLRAGMSTRSMYSGEHRIELQVNGSTVAKGQFDLQVLEK